MVAQLKERSKRAETRRVEGSEDKALKEELTRIRRGRGWVSVGNAAQLPWEVEGT